MKPITIIGGGLAGLTLGIVLRKKEIPVKIIEAGRYPRHRVCGEFISGAGIQTLNELALNESLRTATKPATHAAFFSANQALGRRHLPQAALTVSRFHLDAALAENFCKLGGELRQGERWPASNSDEGVVFATGRRAQPVENGWRWFGLKIHARKVKLEADLEMHIARSSYVGLCGLAGDEVNVCGLFRRRTNHAASGEALDWLRGEQGSILFERLQGAEFDPGSFCSVAGLSLRPQAVEPSECRIGDALTMIPPITGNGMSMAFESASVAKEPLVAYAHGESGWNETTKRMADALSQRFARRLSWASLFHRVLFSRFNVPALRVWSRSMFGWRASFAVTR